jgi:hypothetical protein
MKAELQQLGSPWLVNPDTSVCVMPHDVGVDHGRLQVGVGRGALGRYECRRSPRALEVTLVQAGELDLRQETLTLALRRERDAVLRRFPLLTVMAAPSTPMFLTRRERHSVRRIPTHARSRSWPACVQHFRLSAGGLVGLRQGSRRRARMAPMRHWNDSRERIPLTLAAGVPTV